MSRSNGSGVPPNGWPADYRPVEAPDPYQDPYYTQQAQQQQRPVAPQQPQQNGQQTRPPRIQNAPPSRLPQTGLPQGGLPPPGYPQQQPGQIYGQQPVTSQPPFAQPQYAPPAHPQAYTPPPQAPAYAPPGRPQPQQAAPQQRAPQAQYPGFDPAGRPAAAPSYPPSYGALPSAYVPETTARPAQPSQQPPQQRAPMNYDQWTPGPQNAPAAAHDSNGYDLGNYMPTAAPEPRTQRPTAPPAWQPHAEPEPARQAPANAGYSPPYSADPHGQQSLEPAAHGEEYDEHEDEDEYEDAPRKTRYGLIAASLIVAIAAGGGLAYAYKMFVAPPTQTAATPLVKSGTGPIKVKPVDPGGTKFANADSKMMESLSGSSTEAPADGGPKAVKTLTIERDGTIASQTSATTATPAAATYSAQPVPGMILAGVPPVAPPRAPQPAAAPPAATPVTVQPPPAAIKPAARIVTAAAPPAAAASPDDAEQAAPAAPPAKKPIVKKALAPAAIGGPTGANGFVAVLASVPASASSRMDAMQQYADLQQKFGSVLGSKAPDVVEAKLEKGTFHRLIVGPPASRDAAGSVCTQLKAAGYTADCWVTAF